MKRQRNPGQRKTPLHTLAIRWQRKNRAAGDELARRLSPFVFRRLRAIQNGRPRSQFDFEDICGDGILAAFRAIPRWVYGRKPLLVFIRPDVDRAIRKGFRKTRPLPRPDKHFLMLDDEDINRDAEDNQDLILRAVALLAAIANLPPRVAAIASATFASAPPATYAHTGRSLGLAPKHVGQIARKAAGALRKPLRDP